jgi:hypothetical protein
MASNDHTLDGRRTASPPTGSKSTTRRMPPSISPLVSHRQGRQPDKWQFPAPHDPPSPRFLVVFALQQGPRRRRAGVVAHELQHQGHGEFLALGSPTASPSRRNICPRFPRRKSPTFSFGMVHSGAATTLVAPGAPCSALIPTATSASPWTTQPYNEQGWTAGTTGGRFTTAVPAPSTTCRSSASTSGAMYNDQTGTVYIPSPSTPTFPIRPCSTGWCLSIEV